MKIIANMVGRNESPRYLKPVLAHLNTFVDEIVFTDDCSTDDTPTVAESFGAHIAHTSRPLFEDSEWMLRTLAWKHLEEYAKPKDWILAIDCDELLYGLQFLPILLDQSVYDAFDVTFFHMWDQYRYRTDKAWAPSPAVRLFRYYQGGEYKEKALACGSAPTYVEELQRQGRVFKDSGLVMKHLGYMNDDDKFMKYDKYMRIDKGRYHALWHLESIVDANPTLVEWPYD